MIWGVEDHEMIARAVAKAMETYTKEIELDGTDVTFIPIDIRVHILAGDLKEVGQIIYRNLDYETGEEKGNMLW